MAPDMTTAALTSESRSISSICSDLHRVSEQLLELRRAHPELAAAATSKRDENGMDIDQQNTKTAKAVDRALQKQFLEGVRKGRLLLTLLKVANRNALQHERNLRNDLTDQKLGVGKVDLGYQNIKYQRKYLLNEIARCHDMETFYQDVPLVPLEQFLQSAPEELRNATDERQLMINRLQFELEERKRFDAEKRRLLAVKVQLTKANKARKAQITKIENQLESYIESSQAIQDLFQEPMVPIQTHQELLEKMAAAAAAPGPETAAATAGEATATGTAATAVEAGSDGFSKLANGEAGESGSRQSEQMEVDGETNSASTKPRISSKERMPRDEDEDIVLE
ncbi:hypothetical protein BGZ70_001925 [Mortierella alpina]|uniref:THO complex subunit 5 n=1 Tax=Mortierella alpina TaxID=64518 RepID=A0A9P6JBK4_MORAP|nr:hypothetical protein BGZ70_001925 [Mortierella alpina]